MTVPRIFERQNQVSRVLTQHQTIEAFGDFKPHLNAEGVPGPSWEAEILVPFELPAPLPLVWDPKIQVSKARCHKLVKPFLQEALAEIHGIPGLWKTINDFGGIYNFRPVRKTKDFLSKHCWGIAIDLDVGDNPYGYNPKVHPRVWEIFRTYGFVWGGTFPMLRRDGMHFEFADLRLL